MPSALPLTRPSLLTSKWPYLGLDTEGAWAFLIGALKELGARFSIEAIVDYDAWLRWPCPSWGATAKRFPRSIMSSMDLPTVDATYDFGTSALLTRSQ